MTATPTTLAPLVLVIDDEPDLRTLYELTLLREGYRVETAATVAEARILLDRNPFAAVITDMRLPDGTGLDLLKEIQAQRRPERCMVITAYGSAENAVEALKNGAFDYLTKPVDLKQFRTVVASAIRDRTSDRVAAARADMVAPRAGHWVPGETGSQGHSGTAALERLVGTSEALSAVKRRVVRVARSMAPVLVRGESGTGKELIALAIHACSHRADGPFVAVNCGAIPENLLEAEFFGARKGSYTGATHDRLGYFHAAEGGTLFLDEIGDLPLAMQSKLLRSDLYYRLNVIEIVVPPLRERRADLPALCEALLARIAQESGEPAPTISERALRAIERHPLPGNVRELENLLHRALALSADGELNFDEIDMPPCADEPSAKGDDQPSPSGCAVPADLQTWLDEQERTVITRVLNETGFNRTAAAARLGLNLRQMRYRMARLAIAAPSPGIDPDEPS